MKILLLQRIKREKSWIHLTKYTSLYKRQQNNQLITQEKIQPYKNIKIIHTILEKKIEGYLLVKFHRMVFIGHLQFHKIRIANHLLWDYTKQVCFQEGHQLSSLRHHWLILITLIVTTIKVSLRLMFSQTLLQKCLWTFKWSQLITNSKNTLRWGSVMLLRKFRMSKMKNQRFTHLLTLAKISIGRNLEIML